MIVMRKEEVNRRDSVALNSQPSSSSSSPSERVRERERENEAVTSLGGPTNQRAGCSGRRGSFDALVQLVYIRPCVCVCERACV